MEGKYSLIIMSDSGKTVRWRMSPALLRSLIVIIVLLPLLAAGSIWLNWKLFEDRRAVLAENIALRHDVEANAQTVARLSSLEQFLSQNAPESLGGLVAVAPEPASETEPDASAGMANDTSANPADIPTASTPTGTPAPSPSPSSEAANSAPAADSATPSAPSSLSRITGSAVENGQPNETTGAPASPPPLPAAAADTPAAAPAAGNGATSSEASSPASVVASSSTAEAPAAEGDNSSPDGTLDKGYARVENLTARRVGSRSLRVSFDLFNAGQVPQLAGKTAFELVLKDGTIHPLDPHGDTTYRINRLKKIVGNPILPEGVSDTQGASIRVSIHAGDELILRVMTPVR